MCALFPAVIIFKQLRTQVQYGMHKQDQWASKRLGIF